MARGEGRVVIMRGVEGTTTDTHERARRRVQGPAQRFMYLLTLPQTWLTLGVLTLLLVLVVARTPILRLVVRVEALRAQPQAEAARAWVQHFGPWAPLAYILLFAAQILIAPLPGHFMGLMGGYLFGVWHGSLYGLIGLEVGAGLAAGIARYVGRPVVRRLVEEEQLRYWERRLRTRSPFTWWLIFLFPVPDVVYYVAGLSEVPLRWLLLAVLLGRGPGLIVGNWLGDRAVVLPPELLLAMIPVLAGIALILLRYQRRLRLLLLLILRRMRHLKRHIRR